ncbi:MAG: sulfotransferase domain-containing protein [Elainella sp. Prado103]|jgi:hypothetical protein|nr:sulfotransferase domain-containing protein [Elainella sp. Prado103]
MSCSLTIPVASTITLPNLILAGAPKSGTSSLFALLAAHPNIHASTPKETFYFMDQQNPLMRPEANYHACGLEQYRFFSNAQKPNIQEPQVTFFLEGTTHYLYQETALDFFSSLDSPPHLIFLLRKPSDRILSSFRYTQNNLARIDKSVSFNQFVDLLLDNKLEKIRNKFYSEKSFFVLSRDRLYSEYETFLKQWQARFPAENLHIFLFEELIKNPQGILDRLLDRLEIASDVAQCAIVPPHNPTLSIQYTSLHRMLRPIAARLPNIQIKRYLKSVYFQFQSTGELSHDSSCDSSQISQLEAIRKLDRYFEIPNQRLSQTFNLDLSEWS